MFRATSRLAIAALCVASWLIPASGASADSVVRNLTGLPAYPNLSRAAMDNVAKTDALGRWCNRFSAQTPYPMEQVVAWYRKALVGASETDLASDLNYRSYPNVSGVKMALGIDYVTVFKLGFQSVTYIELFRCSHTG